MGSFHWSPGHCHLWQRRRVIHHWRRWVGSGWYPFELNRSPQQQLRVFPKRFMQINYHKPLRFTDVLMASTKKRKTTHKTNTNALEAYNPILHSLWSFLIISPLWQQDFHVGSIRVSSRQTETGGFGCRLPLVTGEWPEIFGEVVLGGKLQWN